MPTIDMVATGANIKALVKQNKMKVTDVQDVFGFNTPQAIFKWFRGDTMPTIDNMVILAAMFQTTIDQIIVTTVVQLLLDSDWCMEHILAVYFIKRNWMYNIIMKNK